MKRSKTFYTEDRPTSLKQQKLEFSISKDTQQHKVTKVASVIDSHSECNEKKVLTPELRNAMRIAVQDDVDEFKRNNEIVCTNDTTHVIEKGYVAYTIRSFDVLCNAYLKMFSSLQRPTSFDANTRCFLPVDSVFATEWYNFHRKRAKMHILCRACHLETLQPSIKFSTTQVKQPNQAACTTQHVVIS